MSPKTAISLPKRVTFTLVAVALAWLCVEMLVLVNLWLRPWAGGSDYPFLYAAHPYRAYAPVPNRTDRARQKSFNSLGLRGLEIAIRKPADTIRIVCLGGSTTFGDGATTDSTTYPARMERLLRGWYREAPFRIEVINAGVQSYNSLESLIYFQTRLLDLSPDIAIAHHALNDGWFMLEMFDFQSDFSTARRTFTLPPRKWWEYSPLLSCCFAVGSVTNPYYPARFVNLNTLILTNPMIAMDPRKGRNGEMEPQMVAAFERNTRSFVSIARANQIIPVLSTQTCFDDAPVGGRWIRAIERLNNVSRDIAASESVGLIDFARAMPWNPVDYYDPTHLRDTLGGLERQARLFAEGLIAMRAVEQVWERRHGKKSEVRG